MTKVIGHLFPLPISVFSSPATLWSILVVTPMATIWQKGQIVLLPCRFYDFDIFWWPLMFVVHGHTKGGPNYFLIAGCANESTIDDTTGTWSARVVCSLYVDKGCTIHYPLNRVLHFCISSCRLKSGLGMCLLIVKGRLGVLQLWGRKMPPVPLVVSGQRAKIGAPHPCWLQSLSHWAHFILVFFDVFWWERFEVWSLFGLRCSLYVIGTNTSELNLWIIEILSADTLWGLYGITWDAHWQCANSDWRPPQSVEWLYPTIFEWAPSVLAPKTLDAPAGCLSLLMIPMRDMPLY